MISHTEADLAQAAVTTPFADWLKPSWDKLTGLMTNPKTGVERYFSDFGLHSLEECSEVLECYLRQNCESLLVKALKTDFMGELRAVQGVKPTLGGEDAR